MIMNLDFCAETVKTWQVIGIFITIIKLLVPIIIIITSIIPFFKAITKGTSEELMAAFKTLLFKILAGFIVFLAPTIITATIELLVDYNENNNSIKICTSCVNSPGGNECNNAVNKYKDERKNKEKEIKEKEEKIGGSINTEDLNTPKDNNGTTGINGTEAKGNVEQLLKEAKKVTDYVRENNFNYGDAPINPAINHDKKLVSCDRCVGWFLYQIGYTDQPEKSGLALGALQNYLDSHGFIKITDISQIQAGDIMFVNPLSSGNPGHTFLLGNNLGNGIWERYDCGSVYRIRLTGQYSSYTSQPFHEGIGNFLYAYRMPNA